MYATSPDLTEILTPEVLRRSRYTSHWQLMRADPRTVQHKQRRCQYVADKIGASGKKRIVDFGSGTGLLACYLAKIGAGEVLGVEIVPEHLEFAEYIKTVFDTPEVTFTTTLDAPDESLDVIILANVVTHIYRPLETLARMRDALRPGGLLLIEDNNNAASPLVRRGLPHEWADAERAYREQRVGGDKTYGMTTEQARFWADRGDSPSLHGYAPLDPTLKIYHENAFHPRDMAHTLINLGFAVRDIHPKYVFDFKLNRPVSFAFRTMPKLALHISPAYEILAVRV